jgi:hypothetical protein
MERPRSEEAALEFCIVQASNWLEDRNSLRHLKQGLAPRHYVLRDCWEYLEQWCFEARDEALPEHIVSKAALHLNGYYLNLRGALDNLAWMVHFELDLFPGVSEEDSRRRRVDLFGDQFLKALRNRGDPRSEFLRKVLSEALLWGKSLATWRDPAAHRIPLYIPPSTLFQQNQVDEFRRLDALAGAAEGELGGRSRVEILRAAHQIGTFVPVFVVSAPCGGLQPYGIAEQLNEDHREYLGLTRTLLEIFAPPQQRHALAQEVAEFEQSLNRGSENLAE